MFVKIKPATLLPLLFSTAFASPTQNIIASSNQQTLNDAILLHSSKPLVSPSALAASMKVSNLLSRARDLYTIAKISEPEYGHPTRVIGSLGHLGTTNYIKQVLSMLDGYYSVGTQFFPAVSGSVSESRLVINDEVISSALAMSLTPPTKDRQAVFASVVAAANDGCDEADYPKSVKGSIALIKRGNCPFGKKSENAGKAGAVAAIVYNNEEGQLGGTLGTPSEYHVATFGVSDKVGKKYLKKLEDGKEVDASAYIDSYVETITTRNIVAQTILGDQDNCVMLGGHSDSVDAGPGINDDGTGSITLIELAVQLAKFNVNNCVRFAWWSGEEEGLLGSNYYAESLTDEENLKIRLFMDYDMLASPNYALQIYNATNQWNPDGSEELRDLYIKIYTEHGVNHTFIPFDGRSDYVGFIEAGIPAGGIATGAEGVKTEEEVELFGGEAGEWYDHCYHQLCDDLTNVNEEAWQVNAELVAESIAGYAKSFEGFPKRKLLSKEMRTQSKEERRWKYKGSKLVM